MKKSSCIDVITLKMEKQGHLLVEEEAITTSAKAVSVFKSMIGSRDQEVFSLLSLNVKGEVNHYSEVHVGTLNQSIIHPREVFKRAILSNAHAIIIGHNHPSGNLTPSKSDIEVTEELVMCGKLLGIEVHDHIIVSSGEGISVREYNEEIFNGKT